MKRIISKLKCIFIPCQENKFLPKFLEKKFLNYYFVFLLVLKIISVSLIFYLPQNFFFAEITKTALFDLVNQERKKLGLPTLKQNLILDQAAYLKAKDILERDYFAHWNPEGKSPWYFFELAGYDYKAAGENLAIGFLDSEEVFKAWMDSPSHRSNILNPNFIEMGISVLKGEFQGNEVFVVVQLFGSPKISQAQISKEEPQAETQKEEIVKEKEMISTLPQEGLPTVTIEEKKEVSGSTKDKITLNLVKFANLKYHYFLEILIYLTLIFLIFSLSVTIFCDVFIYRRFSLDYKFLIPRQILFIFLFASFLYFDKLTIIRLIPHEFLF